jgi:D-alanyl-lipoteichoic acid acyltransferase DltB (MBOAT superfamily)
VGRTFGKTIAASLALVVVWFTTGLWHGASWAYIAWGGLNGVFIIVSLWLEPVFGKIKAKLNIKEHGFLWRSFATLRTFFVVTMIKVFPEVGGFSGGVGYWKHCFVNWKIPADFSALIYPVADGEAFFVLFAGAMLMFIVSLLQRRKSVRDRLLGLWLPVRILIFALMFIMIIYYGVPTQAEGGGFLYAQF